MSLWHMKMMKNILYLYCNIQLLFKNPLSQ